MPIPAQLTDRERAAVEGYHCTLHTCRTVPGEMCRRDRGLYVVVARDLKRPHADRLAASEWGLESEHYLVTQAEKIITCLGSPVSRGRLVVALGILRDVRGNLAG